jgi:hypothetical protein
MSKSMRLTIAQEKQVYSLVRNITKLDKQGVDELQIKRLIYNLGVMIYRDLNNVGLPVDVLHPRLSAPKLVWSKDEMKLVSEKELVTC